MLIENHNQYINEQETLLGHLQFSDHSEYKDVKFPSKEEIEEQREKFANEAFT